MIVAVGALTREGPGSGSHLAYRICIVWQVLIWKETSVLRDLKSMPVVGILLG